MEYGFMVKILKNNTLRDHVILFLRLLPIVLLIHNYCFYDNHPICKNYEGTDDKVT